MRGFLFLVCYLFASAALCQTTQSDCAVPQNLFNAYQKDVADLALKRMYATHHPDTIKVTIPQIHTDSIWKPLAAVFRLDTIGETDSVFRHYCIHTDHSSYLLLVQRIAVSIDTTYAWTQAWKNSQTTTGYGALDCFLSRHAYTLQQFSNFPWSSPQVILQTTKLNNDKAFADSLLIFSGIISAYSTGGGGDGDKLTYRRDSVAHVGFMIGWHDCPAGCIEKKYWKYVVTDDCKVTVDTVVEYLSNGFGRPIPQGCNLLPPPLPTQSIDGRLEFERVTISPNPVSGSLQLAAIVPADAMCRIYSSVGKLAMETRMSPGNHIDVAHLPVGLYFITVKSHTTGVATGRFIKR